MSMGVRSCLRSRGFVVLQYEFCGVVIHCRAVVSSVRSGCFPGPSVMDRR